MPQTHIDTLLKERGISPDDFHNSIPRMVEVAEEPLEIPDNLMDRLSEATSDLVLDASVLQDIGAAILAGNVILQGPPGTGKSALVRAVARAFNVDLYAVTAHADWSTFDVIGRQELRITDGKEEVIPVDGHFTEAAIRCAGNIPVNQDHPERPQATWLMIDELNRADPDKAFGELFSVLGSADPVDVNLSYQRADNATLTVPRRFRIIATINSIDKQFVNSLSQGLRRRFSFLTVDIPEKKSKDVAWGDGDSIACREFLEVQRRGIARAAYSLSLADTEFGRFLDQELLADLFDTIERVRYADEKSNFPYVPVGTAPIIDTIHLYLVRAAQEQLSKELQVYLDWAFAVKLVPLLEAGGLNPAQLTAFSDSLSENFRNYTRQAVRAIASDGLYSTQNVSD